MISQFFLKIDNTYWKYDILYRKGAKSLHITAESPVCCLLIVAILNVSHCFPEAQTADIFPCIQASTVLPADQAISEAINPRASSAYA
jgi:hypothetical protein